MTDNIIAKTHIGHYTMWHKAVVVDDRRLYLAEDMFCSGYVGGEGHKSVALSKALASDEFANDPISWMEDTEGGDGASILTVDVTFPRDRTLGSMPRSFYLENFSKTLKKLGGQCENGVNPDVVDSVFGGFNSPEEEAAKGQYLTDLGGVNTVCFRTMEIEADKDGKKSIRTLNQGHFGVNGTYEGARRPRSGYIETFKDCKYEQHLLTNR